MKVVDMFLHHDRNILLVQVTTRGAACHTGNESCFYHSYLNEPKNLPEGNSLTEDEDEDIGLESLKKLFEQDNLESQVEIVESSENPERL